MALDYQFRFAQRFEERWLPTADSTRLHGLLFPAGSARGLAFYLHGNSGALGSRGEADGGGNARYRWGPRYG